jgi:hypothetical protein
MGRKLAEWIAVSSLADTAHTYHLLRLWIQLSGSTKILCPIVYYVSRYFLFSRKILTWAECQKLEELLLHMLSVVVWVFLQSLILFSHWLLDLRNEEEQKLLWGRLSSYFGYIFKIKIWFYKLSNTLMDCSPSCLMKTIYEKSS